MKEYSSKIIGMQIKKYRQKKGYTQKALADFVGVSASYIGELERGGSTETNSISMKYICKIAEVLNVSLNELASSNLEFPKNESTNILVNNMKNELYAMPYQEVKLFRRIVSFFVAESKKD